MLNNYNNDAGPRSYKWCWERKELQKKGKAVGCGQKRLIQTLVMRRPLSGKVPAVGRAGSSAEEDPTSVKVLFCTPLNPHTDGKDVSLY